MNKLFIILLFSIPKIAFGQQKATPINISFFNVSTAIPFTKLFTKPIHVGLQIGTEFNYKIKGQNRIFQTVNLGYFYHNHLAQGVAINTEFGYEYRSKFGLSFEGLLGVGYMHTFTTAEEFTFSDGAYTKKKDRGNSRFYPSFSTGMGYYLKKNDVNSPKIFVRYQSWAEYPYSPDFIPVMTHVNLHVGTKFFLNKN